MEAFIERQNLFEARTNDYWTYRIPGLSVTPNGVIIAYTEARKGKGGDWDPIDVLMRRSFDNGVTWDEPRVIVDHSEYGEGPANNFVAIPDRETGEVHILNCFDYQRFFYRKSSDDCETFTDPVEITEAMMEFRKQYDWKVGAFGPGHGIQLSNGRLVVPTWLSLGTGTEFGKGKLGHRPNRVTSFYSDDHGETWECGDMIPEAFPNMNETEAVELENGRVLFNCRCMDDGVQRPSENWRRAITISDDGAHNWDVPWQDPALIEPVCFGSICRFTTTQENGKSRILFSNPNSLDHEISWKGVADRKNLTVRMSYDECESWPVSKVLEPGPSGYSDIAIAPDNTILILFESGMLERSQADTKALELARFNVEWLTDSEDIL